MPRIASTNLSMAGGIVLEIVDFGSVLSRRKYEFRDSSARGVSAESRLGSEEDTASRIMSAEPFRISVRGGGLSPQVIGVAHREVPGVLMPRPRGRTVSPGSFRLSWMIFAWLWRRSGNDFLAVRFALSRCVAV